MARKNRRRRMEGSAIPVPFTSLMVLMATLALGYVWLECRCELVGREIKRLELQQDDLQKQLMNEEFKWSKLKSPLELERALAKHNIEMVLPGLGQIVRIREHDLPASQVTEHEGDALQYASLERTLMNE